MFWQNLPKIKKPRWGVTCAAIRHYVAQPGGAKMLAAYAESLDLSPEQLTLAFKILGEYGNLSSASVLFGLGHF